MTLGARLQLHTATRLGGAHLKAHLRGQFYPAGAARDALGASAVPTLHISLIIIKLVVCAYVIPRSVAITPHLGAIIVGKNRRYPYR